MVRKVAQMYALLVSGLAVLGLLTSGHLFNLLNVDMALDLLRVVLAAGLIYAGFIVKDIKVASAVLMAVGVLYIGMGLLALMDSTLGGLLPSGLTGFDVGFHLLTGLAALGVAAMKHEKIAGAVKN